MRLLTLSIALTLTLGGCDLFKPLEEYDAQKEAANACEYFCESWVYATYDCFIESDGCPAGLPPVNETNDECEQECVTLSNDLDDDDLDKAIDCMWCLVDNVGDTPDCDEVYDEWGDFAVEECENDCTVTETMLSAFDWPQNLVDACWESD